MITVGGVQFCPIAFIKKSKNFCIMITVGGVQFCPIAFIKKPKNFCNFASRLLNIIMR